MSSKRRGEPLDSTDFLPAGDADVKALRRARVWTGPPPLEHPELLTPPFPPPGRMRATAAGRPTFEL
ncbi:MAG: hypothetical protein HY825_12490 [Acidobacteria bacterium]|nr:hypothetical protein [Acidobacteriota bacterium]